MALLALTLAAVSVDARLRLGLAWGVDNRWAKNIAKGNVEWYWHWEMGAVDTMPSDVEYVPNFWGKSKWDDWTQRKKEIKKFNSKRILAFNEPDVPGQSNMNPQEAANIFMQELQPYRNKGVKVSSPQIVWDVDWMDKFLKALRKQGGDVDYMAVHWYGSYKDLAGLKTWVKKINKRYNKAVWLTEYGVTQKSQPSQADVKNFHIAATDFLRSQSYMKRAAWLGCYAISAPPDSFAAARNAFFNNGGSLRKWTSFYLWNKGKRDLSAEPAKRSPGALRHSHARAHRAIIEEQEQRAEEAQQEEDDDEDDGVVYEGEPDDCEGQCKHRQLSALLADDDILGEDDDADDYEDVD